MDLPTCPACGQSVLDEGVDECPFCGASMLGRPSRKAKAPAAKSARPEPSKPAPPGAGSKTMEPRPSAPQRAPDAARVSRTAAPRGPAATVSDDDPFELERAAEQSKAIQASPQRVKGRPYKVVCPMCDTAGYVPIKAAGREVRCANPKCMVPTFTAPAIKKREDESGPETAEKTIWSSVFLYVAVIVVLVGAIGGGATWWVLIRGGVKSQQNASRPSETPDDDDRQATANAAVDKGQTDPAAVTNQPTAVTVELLREQVVPLLVKASLDPSGNRSRALCRRLSAEACAALGEFGEAQNHINGALDETRNVPYFLVPPLVEVAWKLFDEDRADEARRTIDEAWTQAQSLPSYGRDHIDIATQLAAILVKAGRIEDARSLIERHHDDGESGQLSARIRTQRAFGTFDLDSAYSRGSGLPWPSAQAVAVTNELVARKLWDEASAWIAAHADPEGRAACRAAYARAWVLDALRSKRPEDIDRLETVAEKLDSAERARIFAAAASACARRGERELAEKWLERARQSFAELTPPAPLVLPELRDFFNFQLPDPVPYRVAAYAAADIAAVEIELIQPEDAFISLETALAFLRGSSPSLPAIRARIAEVSTPDGRNEFSNRLKRELNLFTNDDAYRKLREYQILTKQFEEAAAERFRLQSQLLLRTADWGLLEPAWQEVRSRTANENPADADPYFESEVPWALADAARRDGNSRLARAIETSPAAKRNPRSSKAQTEHEFAEAIRAGDTVRAASLLASAPVDDKWREARAMREACRLAKSKPPEVWYDFLTQFRDGRYDPFREEALDICAALATASGKSLEVWDLIERAKLTQTERISLCRGLIVGTLARRPAASAAPSVDESKSAGSL